MAPSKSQTRLAAAINAAAIPRKLGGAVGAGEPGAPQPRSAARSASRSTDYDEGATLPAPLFSHDRVLDTEAQIRRIDALLEEVGSKDVQGVARLVSTRRGLVSDLHAELERRNAADVSVSSGALEAGLAEALAEMDADSLRRVLAAVAARAGVELSAWVAHVAA